MSRRLILPMLVLSALLMDTPPSNAACPNPYSQADATDPQSAIRIRPGGNNFNISSGTGPALNAALAEWNSVCGSNVPTLSKTRPSSTLFRVNYMKGVYDLDTNPNACAGTTVPPSGSVLGGGTITIFEQTRSGVVCTGLYEEMTAHEIGHRLGLNHSNCINNIMTATITPAMAGLKPTAIDCAAVDDFWLTEEEASPPSPPECNCAFAADCDALFGSDEWATWECRACHCVLTNSPLVLYLPDYLTMGDDNQQWWKYGFCSSSAPTVCLDWKGDGIETCTAWTEPKSEVAFVLTLSDDDVIRLADGLSVKAEPSRHLFGNVTQGPRGGFPYAHGFEALAAHCGLHPEAIEKVDFASCGDTLHVWADRSSDGIIDFDELLPFQELGVESLNRVRRTDKTDKCGNTFPAESRPTCSGYRKCGIWLDVFFESR